MRNDSARKMLDMRRVGVLQLEEAIKLGCKHKKCVEEFKQLENSKALSTAYWCIACSKPLKNSAAHTHRGKHSEAMKGPPGQFDAHPDARFGVILMPACPRIVLRTAM